MGGPAARGAVGVLSQADGHGLRRADVQGAGRRRPAHAAPTSTATGTAGARTCTSQAVLAQPIFTFGRAAAGKRAASARVEVERARVTAARNVLALEVRKLYWLHLFAKSMRPALDSAAQLLDKARKKADEEYEDNTGKVTNVDIQRLAYGHAELEKFRIQAEIGEDLALAALKHTMGLPQNAALVAADEMLPDPPDNLPAAGPAAEAGLREPARVDPDPARQAGGAVARAVREAGQRPGGVPGRPVQRRLDPPAPRRQEPLLLRSLQPDVRRHRPRAPVRHRPLEGQRQGRPGARPADAGRGSGEVRRHRHPDGGAQGPRRRRPGQAHRRRGGRAARWPPASG